jgi:predicted dehydrogenase
MHVECIKSMDNARLVAVCDLVEEKAARVARENGCKAYTRFEDMLADEEIDLVHICVPSGDHANLGVLAAQAGKHVLVEKPIDVTLEAADRLIAACEKAGVLLSCISQHRFADDLVRAKKAMEDGVFGKLTFGGSYTKWYRSQEYYDSGDWRGTWALDGGGALMNQSVHYVDMMQWVCGPVEEVTAYCGTLAHERIEVEDVAAAIIKFKNGGLGMLEGNTTAYPGYQQRLDVYGTQGSVIIENDIVQNWNVVGQQEQQAAEAADDQPAGAGSAAIGNSCHARQIADVVDAVLTGRQPAITGRDARHPLAIILAVYESSRTGKSVKVQ